MSFELKHLSLEGHLGCTEISVLQVDAVCPHSRKKSSSDGLCHLHLKMFGFQKPVQSLEIDDEAYSN